LLCLCCGAQKGNGEESHMAIAQFIWWENKPLMTFTLFAHTRGRVVNYSDIIWALFYV
jgi:hypothetical protein